MADFHKALAWVLQPSHEGGFANNPHDSGLMTYRGISRKNFPTWAGWPIIDRYLAQPLMRHSLNDTLAGDLALQNAVSDFYLAEYWAKSGYDSLASQAVATKLLDLDVNVESSAVVGPAVRCLQRALNSCGQAITVDGHLGPATLGAIAAVPERELVAQIAAEAERFHRQVAADHPNDAVFLAGWVRRDRDIEGLDWEQAEGASA